MRERVRPILITGAHRSGTTWVGRTLGSGPRVTYLHEPFHVHHHPAVCAARFEYWFSYVCHDNEDVYASAVGEMLARAPGIPLVKDPIAIFSAAWLASRFDMRPVVLIRHPAAFAASLKDRRWTHPFAHFLQQPLLMAHHLEPFAADIMRFARVEHDIIDQAALLWTLIYSVVVTYQAQHHDWTFIRHEDLARDPIGGFRTLFSTLDLTFEETAERAICADRRVDLERWRTALTREEIERVRRRTAPVADRFYTAQEWQIP